MSEKNESDMKPVDAAEADNKPLVAEEDRVPIPKRIAYALGGPVDILSVWVLVSIAYPVFNMYLKMRPTQVAIIIMSLRLWDAISDPVMGWISDNTRTRWGRRRPYILLGAVMAGLTYPLIWWFPDGMETWKTMLWVIGFGILFYTGFTIWAMPYQSLLMEMTPDYNERTRVAAFRGYMQTLAGLFVGMSWLIVLLPLWIHNGPLSEGWDLSFDFVRAKVMNQPFNYLGNSYDGNPLEGIRYLSFGIGAVILLLGVIPAFFVKERYYEHNLAQKQEKVGLAKSFKETLSNRQFMILCAFTIFFLLGTSIWDSYGRYVGTYYVLLGDWGRSAVFGVYGTVIYTVMSLMFIPFFKWLSERIGKDKCLLIATIIVFISAATTWFTYNPDHVYIMLLNTFLIGAGYAGLWLMIPSMQADVIDLDELKTGERREGSYSAVFSWVLKLSFCVGYLLSGPLLEWTGFDAGEFDVNRKVVNAIQAFDDALKPHDKKSEKNAAALIALINKDSTLENTLAKLRKDIFHNPADAVSELNAIDTLLSSVNEKQLDKNSQKELAKLTGAVNELRNTILPGYQNIAAAAGKIESMQKSIADRKNTLPEKLSAKLDKRLVKLSSLVGDMKKLLYMDNVTLLNNLRMADELLKDASAGLAYDKPVEMLRVKDPENTSMKDTNALYDKDIAAGLVAVGDSLRDVRAAVLKKPKKQKDAKSESLSASTLNAGDSQIKTLADLKPVTSPEEINAMLRNMRIGYLALPVAALLIALFILKFYTLTHARAAEVREQLEAKRGKV